VRKDKKPKTSAKSQKSTVVAYCGHVSKYGINERGRRLGGKYNEADPQQEKQKQSDSPSLVRIGHADDISHHQEYPFE
jgi:hypothetical protein